MAISYVRAVYGVESCILLRSAGLGDPVVVLNAVGARQGDPLGTMLYALVAQPILEEVADACPSDDAGFGTDHSEVARAYRLYRHLYTSRCAAAQRLEGGSLPFGVTEQQTRDAGLCRRAGRGRSSQRPKLPGVLLYGAPMALRRSCVPS